MSRRYRFGHHSVATALILFLLSSQAAAVTCSEVRALTAAELDYWAARLKVTPQKLSALLEFSFCVLPRSDGMTNSDRSAARRKGASSRRKAVVMLEPSDR